MNRDSLAKNAQAHGNLLSTINAHERDARIRFVDEGHLYFVDGEKGDYTSVSTVYKPYFSEFKEILYSIRILRLTTK